ncbi:MAG: NlpC/P60 family protein, partial [Thermomicrobiales bacterium]
FVPVDAVTSVATMEGGVALSQEAAPEAVSDEWVDPAATEWVEPAADEWVDPAATDYVAPVSAEWVEPAAAEWVEPAAEEFVEPAPIQEGWVDPATGEWVEPAPVDAGWVDPATGEWVEPAATEEFVEPAPAEEWVEPAPAEEWGEPAPVEMGTTGGVEPWGEPIATAYVSGSNGDGAVCRAGAERGTDRLAVLGEGETVEVRGESVGEWQPVNCAGVGGYIHTSLISWEPLAEAVDEGRRGRDRGNAGNAGVDGTASASGNQIANFAMQYVGYPYVYAGEGPYAFDCSGLTKFVVQNTLGMEITHDLFAQYEMGKQVDRGDLRPGDLVFFQNTFRPGLSHNGIYIGNGQFVHAENESTGVKVSDLNSDYYSSRWYGAVRLT